MIKDIRNFSGGMNTDGDPRNIPNGDYITASSIAVGMSKIGGVRNMLGNTLIPFTMPAGNNTCIGSLRNIRENSIIYFVYNDLGNHSILEYYCQTRTIQPILIPFTTLTITFTTDFLGFTLENKIHSSNIVDNILTWVDNNVSPKQINKQSARDFVNRVSPSATALPYSDLIATGTLAQKLQFIETIKYKPYKDPGVTLGYDSTRATNYIQNKMVQVKYRYIYQDNEYSRWSVGSWVTLPGGTENNNGVIPSAFDNNYVNVTIDTGHPTVKAVEVAFRFGNYLNWVNLIHQ